MSLIASKNFWLKMKPPSLNLWLVLAFIGSVSYPPLVYFGMTIVSPKVLVLIGVTLVGMRLFSIRQKSDVKIEKITFLVAAFGLIALLCVNARLAVQAYPVVVSLSIATLFGASLLFPPTVVERIARLKEPDLSPSGVIYTRKVTVLWMDFLLANAGISTATALWGTLAQWTLWNSFLSYIFMGILFTGEWIVRQRVRR